MAFQAFPGHAKKVTLPSGITYSYAHFRRPEGSKKPYILFLHGFPSSSLDWLRQAPYFHGNLGYGALVPDLLGYGQTDSPDSLEAYSFKQMSEDIVALLGYVGIEGEKLHIVGHDFGSIFLSVLVAYHPEICLTTTFLAVPYSPPGAKVDMEKMKEITEKTIGFEFFGYRRFLWRDDSWEIIGAHKTSFDSLMYGPAELQVSNMLPPGKLEAWLKDGRIVPRTLWITASYLNARAEVFSAPDAYRGPTNWYRARFRDFVGIDEEKKDLGDNPRLPCPAMFMSEGHTLMGEQVKQQTGRYADEYVYKEVKNANGHFLQLEAPEEVNGILKGFFEKYD